MVFLWTISVYLIKKQKPAWITVIPAMFMTTVIFSYILVAPEGLALDGKIGYPIGILITIGVTAWFFIYKTKLNREFSVDANVVPEIITAVEEPGFKKQKAKREE